MNGKISFLVFSVFVFVSLLNTAECRAFTLSTGAIVDWANLPAPKNKGNGAAAEKWCQEVGKRLPTLEELREMYKYRDEIGGFTDGYDVGGWPYWSQRATHRPDGQDFGYRIVFGNGSQDRIEVEPDKFVKKAGEQGEEQYRPFWIGSKFGAYIKCVYEKDSE